MGARRDKKAFRYHNDKILFANECLTWSGRPGLTRSIIRKIPMACGAIVFFVVAYFLVTANSGTARWAHPILILAMAIMIWPASGPIRACLRATRTYYAITDRRVIILIFGEDPTVRCITAGEINTQEHIQHADGRGSIRLVHGSVYRDSEGVERWETTTYDIWGIAEPRAAAEAIDAMLDTYRLHKASYDAGQPR